MTLTDHQSARMAFRVELFQRQGMDAERAQGWADRLVMRDEERDDRRLCVECKNLFSDWRCSKRGAVITDQLQRCPSFTWNTPKQ